MYDKHWTDEELFELLYELRPEDNHLAGCTECALKLSSMRARYEKMRSVQVDVSAECLAAQRRAVHARIHAKRHTLPRVLIPIIGTALVATIVIVHKPSSVVQPVKPPVSDSELFEDVFNEIADPLPTSAGPIRSLFEAQK
jgi:predicted anti-sigma-YlaC factor YlaD